MGSDLGLTILNLGSISGGLSGAGARADAIRFTGGINVLELRPGSTINGRVVAFSAFDTLRLGGFSGTRSSFDVGQINTQEGYVLFGKYEKTGGSNWTLTGSNAGPLPWTINAGTLTVNATMPNSSFTVNPGGTFAGSGTVKNVTNNGGTISPGSSIGTLTIQGSLVLTSAAVYLVDVSSNQSDLIHDVGTASAQLGGIVQAVFAPGNVARSYDIVQAANGFGGTTFSGVTSNLPPGFTVSLSYTPTDVLLNVTAALGGPQQAVGLSQNQQGAAGAINNFFNNGGTLPLAFVPLFGLTGSNLTSGLDQLSGEPATGAQKVGFQLTDQFLNLMLDPFVDGRSGVGGADHPALGFAPERETMPPEIALAYASVFKEPRAPLAPVYEPRWTAWAGAYGGSNRTTGDIAIVGSHDLAARTVGGAAGLDYHLTPNTVVGFALGGGGTDWSLSQGLGGG